MIFPKGGESRHLVEPGGAWVRHTDTAIAEMNGDGETLERLNTESDKAMEKILSNFGHPPQPTRVESIQRAATAMAEVEATDEEVGAAITKARNRRQPRRTALYGRTQAV